MDNENFADAPKTIGELRSDRSRRAKDWTPRDVLIELLRRIDSGEVAPEALFVAFRTRDQAQDGYTSYSVSSPDYVTTLGLVHAALDVMKHDARVPC